MKKQELLDALNEALRTEEAAISIYSKHFEAFSTRLDIDPKIIEQIQTKIAYLNTENQKHKNICIELIQKVKEKNQDDI
ncbi:MAG TPA: hypothetical protein P5048_01080 [Chlamydiales bacterium]|nr:hypothetical protein [Chlamydiales bacterium]